LEADGPDHVNGTALEVVFHPGPDGNEKESSLGLLVGDITHRFVRTREGWQIAFSDFRKRHASNWTSWANLAEYMERG